MEASIGLPAGAIGAESRRPKIHLRRHARWPGPAGIPQRSSPSSLLSTVFYTNYFKKATDFILTLYGAI